MPSFVILAVPRSGSNLLCSLLQSHPDVLCHHELFNPKGIFLALPLRNSSFSLGDMAMRNTNPLAFLQRAWQNKQGHTHIGFKMTYQQQLQVFNAVCADPHIHKIVLKREARLKTYVSKLIAERNQIWENYQSVNHSNPPLLVNVDYQALQVAIRTNEQYYADLDRATCGPRTNVLYETLLDTHTQQRLLNELKLCQHPLTSPSQQQNPQPVKALIANSEALARKLNCYDEDDSLLKELQYNTLDSFR